MELRAGWRRRYSRFNSCCSDYSGNADDYVVSQGINKLTVNHIKYE